MPSSFKCHSLTTAGSQSGFGMQVPACMLHMCHSNMAQEVQKDMQVCFSGACSVSHGKQEKQTCTIKTCNKVAELI